MKSHLVGLILLLMFHSPITHAQAPSNWATVDATGPTPKLEAGQQLWVSLVPRTDGSVVVNLKELGNAIFVTCLRDGSGLDANPCIASVVRDSKDKKKIRVVNHGVVRSADGSSTVLTPTPIRAKFSLMTF